MGSILRLNIVNANIEDKLKGNLCGLRNTSCADQLAIAVRKAYEELKNE